MTTALEKYVFLITSDTYKDDTLNLLCLEKGMKYRFRYREKWVPMEFFERDNQGREKYLGLVGKNGLVIFLSCRPIQRKSVSQYAIIKKWEMIYSSPDAGFSRLTTANLG